MSVSHLVHVHALDPVSASGIEAALRPHPLIKLIEFDESAGSDSVAVAAVESLTDPERAMLRRSRVHGCRRLVLVCSTPKDLDLFAAVELGVCAVLPREQATASRLSGVVLGVAAGEAAMPADLLGKLLDTVARLQHDVLSPRGLRVSGMAEREVQILKLVADGMGTREIARELSYSERTVKNVLHDVATRFQLKNRSHAVAYAVREGLI